jgi:hypothetical protein
MSLARVRALAVLGVMALVAVFTVGWAIVNDKQNPGAASPDECVGSTQVPFPRPEDVQVNVYNATDEGGLASKVAEQLKAQQFKVKKVGNDPAKKAVTGAAEIRYGREGAGAAQLLLAHFTGATKIRDKRTDASVDVAVGSAFTGSIATKGEVSAALISLGKAEVECPDSEPTEDTG